MAKKKAYRWRGWRTDLKGGTITGGERAVPASGREKGITNGQAKLLAKLQRRAGVPYSGRGMSAAQAHAEIQRLLGPRTKRP